MINVGKCVNVNGDVSVRSQALGDGPLVRGAGHDLSTPLTLPSQVVIETFMGPGLEKAFLELVINGADTIDDFQPFDIMNDQFLERQLISKHVYSSDVIREEPSYNELLEDAFVGERFRLRDGER